MFSLFCLCSLDITLLVPSPSLCALVGRVQAWPVREEHWEAKVGPQEWKVLEKSP